MKRIVFLILLTFLGFYITQAQELNAKLTINTQKVQVMNRDIITSLEDNIKQLLSEQQWTSATFNTDERIDCSVAITINEMPTDNTFSGEIMITSRRPVYNSIYITPLFNYRDTKFNFDFIYGQSLDYNNMVISNNLIAVIAYYAYVIIGLDFDSFSPEGGKQFFAKAMSIANSAQTLNTIGWEPFSGKDSRYDLALALTEESSKIFHTVWYNYHRLGLDEMAANPSRGRIRIMEALNELKTLRESRPSSPLLTLFGEAKLDEILKICSEATPEEKSEMKKTLKLLFPAKGGTINNLK